MNSPLHPIYASAAVEGDVDEVVLRRVVSPFRLILHAVYGKKGKHNLTEKLPAYNAAAQFAPWIVLRDLNQDAICAPELTRALLPIPSLFMCFRIVVRQVEAWLFADPEELGQFLGVPMSAIPNNPEGVANPKQEMVNLARSSRFRTIREDMVPRAGSGRSVGPAYTSRLVEFASKRWRPDVAEQNSDSLSRCRARIKSLIQKTSESE
jgi:hypothetical protein